MGATTEQGAKQLQDNTNDFLVRAITEPEKMDYDSDLVWPIVLGGIATYKFIENTEMVIEVKKFLDESKRRIDNKPEIRANEEGIKNLQKQKQLTQAQLQDTKNITKDNFQSPTDYPGGRIGDPSDYVAEIIAKGSKGK